MAKTHREIEDESMRLVSDSSNLSKGGEDYDEKYKKLLGKYGLERKETDFEKDMKTYSPSIKAGIKTSQERNKALAESRKETPKAEQAAPKTHRTIEEEPMKPQKSGGSKSAKSTPKAALIAPKTRVTVSKSGGAVAETESALSGDKPRLATSKVSKNTPSRMDEKPPTLKNRTTNTSEKPAKRTVYNEENQDVKLAKEPRGIFKKGPLTLAVEEEYKRKQKALRAKWKKTLGFETLKINKKATDEEGRNILG